MNNKTCPKCQRQDIEFYDGFERCLWRDCFFVNFQKLDLTKTKVKIRYKKFIAAIKIKKTIGVL